MLRSTSQAAIHLERLFPDLAQSGYRLASACDRKYNCIAFAAGDTRRWWWPDEDELDFWPHGVIRQATVQSFIDAFATLNYTLCPDADVEAGFEKIAIYASAAGEPLHAARQLASGIWVSKLGDLEDIEHHTLAGVEGALYGRVAQVMKRAVMGPA